MDRYMHVDDTDELHDERMSLMNEYGCSGWMDVDDICVDAVVREGPHITLLSDPTFTGYIRRIIADCGRGCYYSHNFYYLVQRCGRLLAYLAIDKPRQDKAREHVDGDRALDMTTKC
jgi:hypothetical protein